MYRVPQAGLTKPAVVGQIERGVRPHRTGKGACAGECSAGAMLNGERSVWLIMVLLTQILLQG
jgi:hypothetical protein